MGITRLSSSFKRRKPSAILPLWPWEKATLPPHEITPGWAAATRLPELTMLLIGLFMMLLSATTPAGASPLVFLLAIPLGRLVALDLTTHTLPDVYTVPLLAMGLAHAWAHQRLPDALLALVLVTGLIALVNWLGRPRRSVPAGTAPADVPHGLGGGDLKLMLALFAWLGTVPACFAIGAGCLLWLPCGFWRPRMPQPFGVALALGWLFVLCTRGVDWSAVARHLGL